MDIPNIEKIYICICFRLSVYYVSLLAIFLIANIRNSKYMLYKNTGKHNDVLDVKPTIVLCVIILFRSGRIMT